jgi:hypothetical protein
VKFLCNCAQMYPVCSGPMQTSWRASLVPRSRSEMSCSLSRDVAAGLLTGDPAGGTAILEKRPDREPHDGLSAMRRNDCPRWTGICTQRSSTIILPP